MSESSKKDQKNSQKKAINELSNNKQNKNKKKNKKSKENYKSIAQYLLDQKIKEENQQQQYINQCDQILMEKLKKKFAIRQFSSQKNQQKNNSAKTTNNFFIKENQKNDEKKEQTQQKQQYCFRPNSENMKRVSIIDFIKQKKKKGSEYFQQTKQIYNQLLIESNQNQQNEEKLKKLDELVRLNPVSYKTIAYFKFKNHKTKMNLMQQNFKLSQNVRRLAISQQVIKENEEEQQIKSSHKKYFKQDKEINYVNLDKLVKNIEKQNPLYGQKHDSYEEQKSMVKELLSDKKSIKYHNELLYAQQVHQIQTTSLNPIKFNPYGQITPTNNHQYHTQRKLINSSRLQLKTILNNQI